MRLRVVSSTSFCGCSADNKALTARNSDLVRHEFPKHQRYSRSSSGTHGKDMPASLTLSTFDCTFKVWFIKKLPFPLVGLLEYWLAERGHVRYDIEKMPDSFVSFEIIYFTFFLWESWSARRAFVQLRSQRDSPLFLSGDKLEDKNYRVQLCGLESTNPPTSRLRFLPFGEKALFVFSTRVESVSQTRRSILGSRNYCIFEYEIRLNSG